MSQIQIRSMIEADRPFVFSTWLKSFKRSKFASRIRNDIYFKSHHKVIERILTRPTVFKSIAHVTNEPDVIIAYLIYEEADEFIVHYAFTKEPFRLMGIQSALLTSAAAPSQYLASHWTFDADPIMSSQERVSYDPYRA